MLPKPRREEDAAGHLWHSLLVATSVTVRGEGLSWRQTGKARPGPHRGRAGPARPRDNVGSVAIVAARVLPRTAGPGVLVLPKCPGA